MTINSDFANWWQVSPEGYRVAPREMMLPPGETDVVGGALDLSRTFGVTVRGRGGNATLAGDVDLTGAIHASFYDVTIRGRVLLARDARLRSAGYHRFVNCSFENDDAPCVDCVASECNSFVQCRLNQTGAMPAMRIRNKTDAGPASTMQCLWMSDCSFTQASAHPNSIVVLFDNNAPAIMSDIVMERCYFAGGRRATIGIDIQGQFQQVRLAWSRAEDFGLEMPLDAIAVSGPGNLNHFVVEGGSYPSRRYFVNAPVTQLAGCRFRDIFAAWYGAAAERTQIEAACGVGRRALILCRLATTTTHDVSQVPHGTYPATEVIKTLT